MSASVMNTHKRMSNKKVSDIAINPRLIKSPFSIPDSPQYISTNNIKKIKNIYILKKLEHKYDEFLEKKCHILLLLNVIDEVFEKRDEIIMHINSLERERRYFQMRHEYDIFIKKYK